MALDFPNPSGQTPANTFSPTSTPSASTNGVTYVYDGNKWVAAGTGGGGGGIEEAPTDGQQYGRQNSSWSVVQAGGGDTTINYNGAAAWGNVAADGTLNGGMNCTSARTGTGAYTVTFTNPMPDANYSVVGSVGSHTSFVFSESNKTPTQFTVQIAADSGVSDQPFSFAVHALNAMPPQGGTGTDAWATINGTTGQILSSFNIDSVTRPNGAAGDYTISFVNPMPNGNYAVSVDTSSTDGTAGVVSSSNTANSFRVITRDGTGTVANPDTLYVSVNATNASLPNTITQDQIAALIQNPTLSAWARVNVNGISNNTNGTLEGSFNIEECKRTSAGEYTFKFINPVPAGYSINAICDANTTAIGGNPGTDGFVVRTRDSSGNLINCARIYVQVASTARNGTLGGGADAWATTSSTGDLQSGFNVTAAKGSAGLYDYTFTNAMPNSNYAVVVSQNNPSANKGFAQVISKTANGFSVATYNGTGDLTNRAHELAVFATDGNAGGFWVREGQGADEVLKPLNSQADVQVPSLNGGPLAGFRNMLINGNMIIAQRGEGPATGSGYVTADRWSFGSSVESQVVGLATAVGDTGITNMLRATSTDVVVSQAIEMPFVAGGPRSQLVIGEQYTISLIALDATDAVSVNVRYADGAGGGNFVDVATDTGYVAMTSENLGGGLTRYTRTFTVANNLPAVSNRCILVSLNPTASAGTTVQFGNIQLEPGSVATPFEYRPYGTELALCQRYFEVMNTAQGFSNAGIGNTTQQQTVTYKGWKVQKRVQPTLTTSNVTENGGASDGGPAFFPSTYGCGIAVVIAAGVVLNVSANIAGDAEL